MQKKGIKKAPERACGEKLKKGRAIGTVDNKKRASVDAL